MTITSDDALDLIKITIALVIGYILVKALLFGTKTGEEETITKCVCDCAKEVIKLN